MMQTPRIWAAGTLVVLLGLLAVFAAMTIPWHRPPAPRADQLAALAQLPADKVSRARDFHAELRPGSYAAMAISLAGGLKGQGGIVAANAVGSNIFVLTLTLGLAALAAPIVAGPQTLRFDVPVMLGSALLLCLLLFRPRLHWRTGLCLLLLYAAYLAYQFEGK